jgi:hypothetical protein
VCLYTATRLTETGPVNWVSYTPERLAKAFKEHQSGGDGLHGGMVPELQGIGARRLEQHGAGETGISAEGGSMKVDLTGSNPAGREKLREAGSLTIPLLVVYRPDGWPVFMGDFYAADQVVQAVTRAVNSSGPAPQPPVAVSSPDQPALQGESQRRGIRPQFIRLDRIELRGRPSHQVLDELLQ